MTRRSLYHRDRKGFSLVEILCAVTVMAIVMVAILTAVSGASTAYTINVTEAAASQASRVLMSRISREIRMAEDVDVIDSGVRITLPDDSDGAMIYYIVSGGRLHAFKIVDGDMTYGISLGPEQGFTVTGLQAELYKGTVYYEDANGETQTDWRTLTATIEMTVERDGQSRTLMVSASPRPNQPN